MWLDGLLFREAVESDIAALQSFRNDPVVNHFMVRTYVDPDDVRREWQRLRPLVARDPSLVQALEPLVAR